MGSGHVALARFSIRSGAVVVHWLTERDHVWLTSLIEEYAAFVGEPRHRLDDHLARLRTDTVHARPGWGLALHALNRAFRTEMAAVVSPPLARAAVFGASACDRPRQEVLERIARDLDTTVAALESSLFADLPSERILRAPAEPLHASSVALQCNLTMAQALLKRSSQVTIEIAGNAKAVVRHAKLRGLICTVSRPGGRTATLEISGPLALFRKTAVYGRHLAELVPLLPWSDSFELHAECTLRDQEGHLILTPSDPILPGNAPRPFDSLLERRLARDFKRAATDWELVREPEPIAVEGTLIFPDFALVHRRNSRRRWLLEIVGFWTSAYLEKKLRRLRKADIRNLVLCIDSSLDCGEGSLPRASRVLRFRKRIDPLTLIGLIDTQEHDHPAAGERAHRP